MRITKAQWRAGWLKVANRISRNPSAYLFTTCIVPSTASEPACLYGHLAQIMGFEDADINDGITVAVGVPQNQLYDRLTEIQQAMPQFKNIASQDNYYYDGKHWHNDAKSAASVLRKWVAETYPMRRKAA
jgi:hypothetical protein